MRVPSTYVRLTLASVAVGAAVGLFLPSVTAHAADTPERPGWIRADGTIDETAFPAEGLTVINSLGEDVCTISLTEYINAGGAMAREMVTEANTPLDEFEADASSSHTDLDEFLNVDPAPAIPAETLC
jgi:hypothetical protein